MNGLARLYGRVLVAGLVAMLLLGVAIRAQRAQPMTSLIPAYVYPAGAGAEAWDRICQAARFGPVQAVINPASGPGTIADPNYVAVVKKLRAAGGKALGYVHTSYGARETGLVRAEVQAYLKMYDVDGFFVDEMSTSPIQVSYYSSLCAFIKEQNKALEVVGNPGTNTSESYVLSRAADRLVIFEGPAASFPDHLPARWVRHYRAERFAHIIYDTSTAEAMLRMVALSASNHAGTVFISDGAGSNPYDRLPPYWQRFCRTN
jgi:Spherulation-specific family 4